MKPSAPQSWLRRVVQSGALSLLVCELPERPADARDSYGSVLWPAASFLASRLTAADVEGRTVLEIGCGNGLCSLAALSHGAERGIATDYRPLLLALLEAAAQEQPAAVDASRLETVVFDMAAPMPEAGVISTRARARKIPACDEPLPPHQLLLAADLGYSTALAWRLGERCREAVSNGARVLVAESRQMPDCRSAFSEALNLGRPQGEPKLRLRACEHAGADGFTSHLRVAVGGSGGEDEAPMWFLDATAADMSS